jgi:hypothetical protein
MKTVETEIFIVEEVYFEFTGWVEDHSPNGDVFVKVYHGKDTPRGISISKTYGVFEFKKILQKGEDGYWYLDLYHPAWEQAPEAISRHTGLDTKAVAGILFKGHSRTSYLLGLKKISQADNPPVPEGPILASFLPLPQGE